MASITLSTITKSFGETPVLRGIDLDIADGEFLTLLGPSGCGKSTLLRIIAGLEGQDGGDVAIGGRVVNGVRPSARDLAMVFQSYALYPHLTVERNMMTPLTLRDLGLLERLPLLRHLVPGHRGRMNDIKVAVRETAEILKIEPLLQRKPGQLSGGQRQRAALGRAMVRKPAAFLMDEPLSNLDAALRVHMRAELAELHRALGTTFVYVTHDQAEALTMSSRVAVMMEGELLQLSTPEEIYDNPEDLRVAEFIGSPKINTIPGEIDGAGRVTAQGLRLQRLAPVTDGKVTVAIRPEHLEPVEHATPEEALGVTVVHKENLGADVYLHGVLESASLPEPLRIVARALPEAAARYGVGDWAAFRLSRGEAMVFGADRRRMRLAPAAAEPLAARA
ncbi:MAG: ABC transporter ATP-binding protein [Pseudomonadota bacterium]